MHIYKEKFLQDIELIGTLRGSDSKKSEAKGFYSSVSLYMQTMNLSAKVSRLLKKVCFGIYMRLATIAKL